MERFWRVLELQATKDLAEIKNAYRKKLIKVNPEDDPEGFKKLRSAYEKALDWASKQEVPDEEESLTGRWLKKVKEVYECFSKRIESESWSKLLKEEACNSLDTWDEARTGLLAYLMEHSRLPGEIWKMLNDHFHLVEDKEEFSGQFPANFLDYVVSSCLYKELIDYKLFEEREDGAYDEMIGLYFQLRGFADRGEALPEELEERIEELELYHPYIEVEKARLQLKAGNIDDASEVMERLYRKYPEDTYILYYLSSVGWERKEYEKAYKYSKELVQQVPGHFLAKQRIAKYHLITEDYQKAKDEFIEILEVEHQNMSALEGMKKANESLISFYQEKMKNNPQDLKTIIALGWCLFQNESFQDAIALLDRINPDPENTYSYHNLKGRLYLCTEDYQNALSELEQWYFLIQELKADGTEETEQRLRKFAYANYTIASCYFKIQGGDSEENFKKGMSYLDTAIGAEENFSQKLSYLSTKSIILLKKQQYREAVDVCDLILKEDDSFFAAYVTRQEAYYHLEHYQKVIDDYYQATSIYSGFLKPYLFAVKTFWIYRDNARGMDVVRRAEEAGLKSDNLTLYKLRFLRNQADSLDDFMEAYELCNELKERCGEEDCDLEDKSEVYYEGAASLYDQKNYKKALEDIEEAILLGASNNNYLYLKGNIYLKMGYKNNAMQIFEKLNEKTPGNAYILNQIAGIYADENETEKAIEMYHKVLQADSGHINANHSLMKIYERLWKRTGEKEKFELGLKYINAQLATTPEEYYYIERGLYFMSGDYLEEAIADFKKALEYDSENLYAYNNLGTVYFRQRKMDLALEALKQSVLLMREHETILPCKMLARCYMVLQRYEEALKYYKKNVEMFPENQSVLEDLGEFYRRRGFYEESVNCYKKAKTLKYADTEELEEEINEIYKEMGLFDTAVSGYRNMLKLNPKNAAVLRNYGDYLLYEKENIKGALKKYIEALKCSGENTVSYVKSAFKAGISWYYLGNMKKARLFLDKCLKGYLGIYGSIEKYLSIPEVYPVRCYIIGDIYFYMGNIQRAEEYYSKMLEENVCNFCQYPECYEYVFAKGRLLALEGNTEGAALCYHRALELEPNYRAVRFELKRLYSKKKRWRDWL